MQYQVEIFYRGVFGGINLNKSLAGVRVADIKLQNFSKKETS